MPEEKRCRCAWVNLANKDYVRYHDTVWGVPVRQDAPLFESLVLECFQAGLSFECVFDKRNALRYAFSDFRPEKVCRYTDKQLDALTQNPDIIRHAGKIYAVRDNAVTFLNIVSEFGSFYAYLCRFTQGKTFFEQGKTTSALSDALAKDLKKRGMKYVGSKTVYAFLQAVGVVYAHEPTCFLAAK